MTIYRTLEHVESVVENVLEQTCRDLELIVIYNKGVYNVPDILANRFSDMRIKLIPGPHNYIEALNVGVTASVGKYLVPIDERTAMYRNRLKIQSEFMESHPDTDVCGSYIIKEKQPIASQYPIDHNNIISLALYSNPVFHSTVILRKNILKGFKANNNIIKLYKEKYYQLEDYRLWVDLATKGYSFHTLPIVLSEYHSCVKTRGVDRKNKLLIQIQYLESVVKKIINIDPEYSGLFENMRQLYNDEKFEFDDARNLVYSIYTKILRQEKQRIDGSKIRILFCMDSLEAGGAEKLLIDILTCFDQAKYTIDLLVLINSGLYFKDVPSFVNVFTLDGIKANLLGSYDFEIAFLEGRAVRYIAQRKTTAKKIAWIHTDLLTAHWSGGLYNNKEEEKSCYEAMDKIVFVTKNAMTQFNVLFPGIASSPDVIHCLVDKVVIRKKSLSFKVERSSLITVCMVGRLVSVKGYDRLIPIIDRLKKDGLCFNFWIIGEGPLRASLKSDIDKFLLNDIIKLIGFTENPYPYIKASDIFVSTSLVEGFSLVIAEALCLGKPVVATDTAGAKELLDDGQYGLLMGNDEESVYSCLRKILMDEDLRISLAKKALLRSRMFNGRKTMEQIYNLFS